MMDPSTAKKIRADLRGISESAYPNFLKERFAQLETKECLDWIEQLCNGAVQRDEIFEKLLVSFLQVQDLGYFFNYETLASLYETAGESKKLFLQALLLRGSHRFVEQEASFSEEEAPRLSHELESFTLGERRAFAKQNDPRKLQMLLYDNDPVVIGNLLNNPKILEQDVLQLASRRPQRPDVLREIFQHRRWSSRYEVKKALIMNPQLPHYIGVGLTHFMSPSDLKFIVEEMSDSLPELLVDRARQLRDRC